MSVEYRSGLAKGWIIPEDQYDRFSEEAAEELTDNGNLFCLNSWCGGDYILAVDCYFASEDSVADVGNIEWLNYEDSLAYSALVQFFPERADEKPNLWLFTEVC